MPRILVADDNSNIQKMVALALQGEGIEVIGVGNGEAAVRKVPEIHPDVILADVFMPVRSGYEVCEFVKNDSRYMHTPVVLLVGAFDPLDEREAQRVRADGVLKKPFVPPEPLVNLVKALLVKSASERLVAVGVPAASASAVAEVAQPKAAPEIHEPEFSDEPAEEFPAPAPSLKVGEYDKPVAFGALLEAPAEELPALDETDPIVTSPRDPNLGEPAFWTTRVPKPEEAPAEEGEATEHSWGRAESLPGMDEAAVLDPVEPEVELDREAARTMALEISPAEEAPAAVAPQSSQSEIHHEEKHEETAFAEEIHTEAAAGDHLRMEPAPTLIEWPRPEKSEESLHLPELQVADASPIAKGPDPALEPPIGTEPTRVSASVDSRIESTAEQAAELQSEWRQETEAAPESKPAPAVGSAAPPAVPEVQPKHEEMASSWPPAFQPVTSPADPSKTTAAPKFSPKSSDLWPSMNETVPAAPVASPSAPRATEALAALPKAAEAMAAAAADLTESTVKEASASGSLSPEMIEAVVTRIVDRMQPKVLEMVTREILRPVVEALVRREIGKK